MKKLFLLVVIIFNLLFSQLVFAEMGRVSFSESTESYGQNFNFNLKAKKF
jgi:hypothetical protein